MGAQLHGQQCPEACGLHSGRRTREGPNQVQFTAADGTWRWVGCGGTGTLAWVTAVTLGLPCGPPAALQGTHQEGISLVFTQCYPQPRVCSGPARGEQAGCPGKGRSEEPQHVTHLSRGVPLQSARSGGCPRHSSQERPQPRRPKGFLEITTSEEDMAPPQALLARSPASRASQGLCTWTPGPASWCPELNVGLQFLFGVFSGLCGGRARVMWCARPGV